MRNVLAWISVLLLALACFLPWTEVTTFPGHSLMFGAMNEYVGGGRLVLVCAAGAAVGLLVRRRLVTTTFAAVALLVSALVALEAPDAMMQVGYEAQLVWGGFLALASSLVLLVTGIGESRPRRALRRRPSL